MPSAPPAPLCAVLVGGAGSRLGGDKHLRELVGRPLGAYPLDAAVAAGLRTALVAKPDTLLEPLLAIHPQAQVVTEPEAPLHPLLGILTALEALSMPVVVCPCDTPHVTPALLSTLATSPATVAEADRGPEPLIGRWEPEATGPLREAIEAGTSARALVGELGMETLAAEPAAIANVNTEADLERSARVLRRLRS
jgi:molybdopterin-guanine dinucleotide biosynthesis protein A